MTPSTRRSHGGTDSPRRSQNGSSQPPRQASTWQRTPGALGHRGDLGDVVDDAVRVARGRADDEGGVLRDVLGHLLAVETEVVGDRDPVVGQVEVLGRLGEGRVGGVGRQQLRLGDALLPGVVPSHLDGQEDALGAAGGQGPGAGLAAEQVAGHEDDLLLHAGQGLVGEGVERVLVQEPPGHLVLQALEHVVVVVVDEAEGPPAPPVDVAGPLLVDLGQERLGPDPFFGEAADPGPGDVHRRRLRGRRRWRQPP